jgi:hypothetical protein
MAGLGRKVWSAGEVLSAADVNGYLMNQAVMVFDDSTARDSAIPTPSEGMVTYTKNDNLLAFYDGAIWAPVDTSLTTINASNVINTLTSSTATAYTFASGDQSQVLRFTAAGTVTATIATSTALTAGQRIDILADGAAGVRVITGAGVTLAGGGAAGTAYLIAQYDAATIMGLGSNTYRIIGNITEV